MSTFLLQLISVYLLFINLATFIAYGLDKRKAIRGEWRIPESTLLLLALLGGALGAWSGMKVFRHKTKHWKFRILVPLMLVLWVALAFVCLFYSDFSSCAAA